MSCSAVVVHTFSTSTQEAEIDKDAPPHTHTEAGEIPQPGESLLCRQEALRWSQHPHAKLGRVRYICNSTTAEVERGQVQAEDPIS